MHTTLLVLAAGSLAAWLYLLLFHGRFWHADQTLDSPPLPPADWPAVAVIVPARNEADVIAESTASLLRQDYPGRFDVLLVDDGSTDGTADIAQAAAVDGQMAERNLRILATEPLPAGWTGKMWAMATGVASAPGDARYLLLTDADIGHDPGNLRRLVTKAEGEGLHLTSLMVRLHCRGFWERLLIPAFVFFFQKLFPFPRCNDPRSRVAAAAGGCMLVRSDSLAASGGIAAIRNALIDDCALARQIKPYGPIWLGLARRTRSLRPYRGLGEPWRMVARTAYTQLRHSPWLLAGTLVGMLLLYMAPLGTLIAGAATGAWIVAALGAGAQAAMWLAYWPTWRLYRGADPMGLLLPVAACLYTLMTLDSARRHYSGAGGAWKGRTYSDLKPTGGKGRSGKSGPA